jgi:hypothetical protein
VQGAGGIEKVLNRRTKTAAMLGGGVMLVAAGVVWAVAATQTADGSYVPRVGEPAFTGRGRPQVVIDEGHYNLHTLSGAYAPFANLLRRDGLWVRRHDGRLSGATLRDSVASRFDQRVVLVVSNALGWRGMAQQALNAGGLERLVRVQGPAISAEEVSEVEAWVRGGGSLLLVADHAPAGAAAAGLSAAFGVQMTNWWAEDEQHHDRETSNPGFLVFTSEAGLAIDHPIMLGRGPREQVHRLMTFTGQALRSGAGVALLTLSSSAREYPFRRSRDYEGRSAAGLAQAVALEHGAGRVVILGEAAMITAQTSRRPDGTLLRFGMNRDGTDNAQFALNVMHWLTGIL